METAPASEDIVSLHQELRGRPWYVSCGPALGNDPAAIYVYTSRNPTVGERQFVPLRWAGFDVIVANCGRRE